MDNPQTEFEATPGLGALQPVTIPDDSPPPLTRKYLPPLYRNRDYMLLWSGQVVSAIGSGATQVVYPLLILALTNSPAAAGIAAALGAIPYILFSLPAGALVDRLDRKRVMILCDVGRAAVLLTVPIAMLFNVLTVWQIYICALLEGSLFVFFNISEVAALSRVVEKQQLPQAVAQNDVAFSIANILAPAFGTTLYQFGRAFPFVFDVVSYFASAVSLFFIKQEFQTERKQTELHLVREIREGMSWLWGQPLIRYMAFCTGGLNFVGASTPLILIVLAKQMGASEAEIGVIFSVSAVGAIAGSIIGSQIQKRFQFGQVIITTVWISALLFPLLAFAPHYWILGIIMAFSWLTGPVYNVVQFSYRVSLIPDALQGRVNSVFRLTAFGFQPFGAFVGGVLIEQYGVMVAIAFFTIWYFGLATITMFNKNVRNARQIGHAPAR